MNKKARKLNKENNRLDELIKEENQEIFTNMICYLRGSDLSDYNIEVVRNDLTEMVLSAQERGEGINQVVGNDYKEFCDSIIETFPGKTMFEKVIDINLDGDFLCEERHYEALIRAKESLRKALDGINNFTLDLISIDIKDGWDALGEVSGKTATEEIINNIFSKFCVGK